MDTTAASFTARKNAKRAAEKMIADGKTPAVDYSIVRRNDGRFEIVWKSAPITGEVEAETDTAATGDGHSSTKPRLAINGEPGYGTPKAEIAETAGIADAVCSRERPEAQCNRVRKQMARRHPRNGAQE